MQTSPTSQSDHLIQNLPPKEGGSEPSITPLSEAEAGALLSVERLEGSEKVCRRLREVGFCEKAEIRLLTRGGQMICSVCGTRLALSRKLAQNIWVKAMSH
ncbi:MAG TPA: FeoA family protein [Chthoniobacterales bacterium]|nr:FeoA family protein [Chthoniobacterales bacterium]